MSKCKVDRTTSPTFKRDVKALRKVYRRIEEDLQSLFSKVEQNFRTECNATLLRMPKSPELQGRVWKYDCPCSEMNRHPRECLRVICIFEEADAEDRPPVLTAIWCNLRKNIPDWISPKEIQTQLRKLQRAREAPEEEEEPV